MIETHLPGKMVSSGIGDVVIASEKTCLKKLMMMIKMLMMMIKMMNNYKTIKKSMFLRRNALNWNKLCCDHFHMLGENPSEEMICSNPI